MPARSTWPPVGWMALVVVVLDPAASGAESPAPPLPSHPLVVAAEQVCHEDLPKACEELVKLAWASAGLTTEDSIRLSWLDVLRSFDNNDEAGARKGIWKILNLDRSAKPPSAAPARIRQLVEEAGVQAPFARPPPDERSRLEKDRTAASERKPGPEVLLGAAQALYDILEIEGTAIVIDVTRSSPDLTKSHRAQVTAWLGVLKMERETDGEAGARSLFRNALELDGNVRLPNGVPPKTLAVFLEVRATINPPPSPSVESPRGPASLLPPIAKNPTPEKQQPPPIGLKTWGVVAGGTGATLIAGGVVAGAVGLWAYEAEKTASANGDWADYVQKRGTAGTAVVTSNMLYGAGVVALGAGAILFLSAPSGTKLVPDVGPGKVSLTVAGSF